MKPAAPNPRAHNPFAILPYDVLDEIADFLPSAKNDRPWQDVKALALTCKHTREWARDFEARMPVISPSTARVRHIHEAYKAIVNPQEGRGRLLREPQLRKLYLYVLGQLAGDKEWSEESREDLYRVSLNIVFKLQSPTATQLKRILWQLDLLKDEACEHQRRVREGMTGVVRTSVASRNAAASGSQSFRIAKSKMT